MDATFADPEKELVASNPEPRNWKGIIISLLVILSVILMVAAAVVWITPPDPGPRVKGERIRLDQILEAKFRQNPFNATYIGSDIIYIDHYGGLSKFNKTSGTVHVLLDNSTFRTLNSHKYSVSDDLNYVMIIHDIEKVFRYSQVAKYTIQWLRDRSSPLIKVGSQPQSDLLQEQELLQHAMLLPRSRGIVYIKNNDIFHIEGLPNGKVRRITESGQLGTIYNGIADWLYEEEVLGQSEAIWVNPPGDLLLFAQFNDSNVDKVTLREYGQFTSKGYPGKNSVREMSFRYPKAGSSNPTVSLYVAELKPLGRNMKITPPFEVRNQENYFTAATWISATTVSLTWMNRRQNIALTTLCHHPQYICKEIHVEKSSEMEGVEWVENRGPPHFSQDGSEMLLVQPVRDGVNGYYPHLVKGPVSTTQLLPLLQLTHGTHEVTQILGWDNTNDIVYYLATLEGQPGERHMFRLNTRTFSKPEPLTLPHATGEKLGGEEEEEGEEGQEGEEVEGDCLYNKIHLSPNFDSYIKECEGPGVPETRVYSLPENKIIWTMDLNNRLKQQVFLSSMPKYRYLSYDQPGYKAKARVRLTLPPVLRDGEEYKFPLIVNVYGGPGTQMVNKKWSVGWDTYLASNRDFIVASLDVRGSGFQGLNYQQAIHNRLGNYETQDILSIIRRLVDQFQFIDKDRVCIWGWSFGGYLAAMVLAEDSRTSKQRQKRTFVCGISVAPVTQWQNYDSAYTERFLGLPTPEGNWKGYSEASLTGKVEHISDNSFMVIHGTADDNVHVQHTMLLAKTLVKNHIIFRQQLYPDENHGLFGVIKHQHETMEAFLDDMFGPVEDFFRDDYYLAAAALLEQLEERGERMGDSGTSCHMC